ncbi:MAG: hypothetical protein QHC89_19690, partial [Bosea sp. (in: a-proteobacteria)]|nr:hypothetical protein [Bosea sp. (in: a-proteobacteria)]
MPVATVRPHSSRRPRCRHSALSSGTAQGASLLNGDLTMKILVPVKRVVDYNVKIRVKADGSGV